MLVWRTEGVLVIKFGRLRKIDNPKLPPTSEPTAVEKLGAIFQMGRNKKRPLRRGGPEQLLIRGS
jgi:hypothetical protein